jgi:HK97 family phage major capsid protein
MDDPVLIGLQSQADTQYAQGQKILIDPAASWDDLQKAQKLFAEHDALRQKIAHREKMLETKFVGEPVRAMPFPTGGGDRGMHFNGRIEPGITSLEKKQATGGFKSIGHFAWSVYRGGRYGTTDVESVMMLKSWNDMQLEMKAPSGMFEDSDPDGGVLVPREFSNQIYTRMTAQNLILQYLSPLPVQGNNLTIPALKEESRADGARQGGILGYWAGEADQYTPSKSRYRDLNLRLHKLTVYTFCTDELVNDSPIALQTFLLDKCPNEINFKINDAVVNGNGNGMPHGILGSTSKITQAAVTGQGAGTVVWKNVVQMYKRVVAGQRGSLIWLYNQEIEDQLSLLFMPTGTAAGIAIFKPNEAGNGFTLYNRPAIVMEQCQGAGTEGDLIAFATQGYACITKGGIESFMSMHLRFDYDETAFKWRFRFDGQPYDISPLTPYKGSNTVSSIVTLSSSRT